LHNYFFARYGCGKVFVDNPLSKGLEKHIVFQFGNDSIDVFSQHFSESVGRKITF
jgi:hypothetical protein